MHQLFLMVSEQFYRTKETDMACSEINFLKLIGNKILFYRRIKGIKQRDLAEKIGANQQSVSDWECGRVEIPFSRLLKVCAALDISLSEFDPRSNIFCISNLKETDKITTSEEKPKQPEILRENSIAYGTLKALPEKVERLEKEMAEIKSLLRSNKQQNSSEFTH